MTLRRGTVHKRCSRMMIDDAVQMDPRDAGQARRLGRLGTSRQQRRGVKTVSRSVRAGTRGTFGFPTELDWILRN